MENVNKDLRDRDMAERVPMWVKKRRKRAERVQGRVF